MVDAGIAPPSNQTVPVITAAHESIAIPYNKTVSPVKLRIAIGGAAQQNLVPPSLQPFDNQV